jgi:hypothetical protein
VNLSGASTDELVAELMNRGGAPCPSCKKWQVYVGAYDRDGVTLRCHGCLRAVGSCTCR